MAGDSGKHIRVSAPGKIILHGEHAVVFQKAAVAISLGLRTRLDLNETADSQISFSMERFLERITWNIDDFSDLIDVARVDEAGPETSLDDPLLTRIASFLGSFHGIKSDGRSNGTGFDSTQHVALQSFLYILIKLCKLKRRTVTPSLSISITSDIVVGAGLGSSAAFSVCIAAALLQYFDIIIYDPKNHTQDSVVGKVTPLPDQLALINHWAFLMEKIIHGNASGVDNSVSTYGGIIKYCNREMTRIPCRLKLDVALIDTLVQRDTKKMVDLVQRRRKLYPDVIDPILDSIDGISNMAYQILQHGMGKPSPEEYEVLSELITMNNNLLCALGVSHPALDAICATARKWGQAAKLTGAGGGGCALVLFDPEIVNFAHLRESLMMEFRKMDFRPMTADIGGPGVLFHHVTV